MEAQGDLRGLKARRRLIPHPTAGPRSRGPPTVYGQPVGQPCHPTVVCQELQVALVSAVRDGDLLTRCDWTQGSHHQPGIAAATTCAGTTCCRNKATVGVGAGALGLSRCWPFHHFECSVVVKRVVEKVNARHHQQAHWAAAAGAAAATSLAAAACCTAATRAAAALATVAAVACFSAGVCPATAACPAAAAYSAVAAPARLATTAWLAAAAGPTKGARPHQAHGPAGGGKAVREP
jgi:hypothetical protein